MLKVSTIENALKSESTRTKLDGWIFTNFQHHDSLTDALFSIKKSDVSTRRWVYIVYKDKPPKKIVHAIEPDVLKMLEGKQDVYYALEDLKNLLRPLNSQTFAVLSDQSNSEISTMDGGFLNLLHTLNIKTTSAGSLIQRCKGVLTKEKIASQERVAALLYKIVKKTWNKVCKAWNSKTPITEKELENYIVALFSQYELVYDHPPIVAFGKNTGNPHYEAPDQGSAIAQEGDIIQFDLWAKERFALDENGIITDEIPIYADISWVGVFSKQPNQKQSKDFENLTKARDKVFEYLTKAAKEKTLLHVQGKTLDMMVRKSLIDDGYEKKLCHRTGHSIDTDCHGSGVNLDCIEFPDERTLLEGSCFSVEPGIYDVKTYGMRTEIDIYIENGYPVLSGQKFKDSDGLPVPQVKLLTV